MRWRALQEPDEAAARVVHAQALYAREYARPIYVQKIRRLLQIVGLLSNTAAPR